MPIPSPADLNLTENGLGTILVYVNQITGDVFINLTLVVLFVIVLGAVALPKNDIPLGAAIAGITTTVFALTLRLAVENLINNLTLGITIAVSIGGVILLFFSNKQ